MRKVFISILLTLVPHLFSIAQNPTYVYWLHGLNSDSSFWHMYQTSLTPQYSDNSSYSSHDSVYTTALAIDNNLFSPAILVGHSAGGIVARKIADIDQGTNTIKGIITFGTPNHGAGIVSSVINQDYYNVIDRAGSKAFSAINSTLYTISSLPFVAISTISQSLQSLLTFGGIEALCLEVCKEWADSVANTEYLNTQLFVDLNPSSNTITTLNQSNQTIPIINFYGEEDTWPLIRLLGSIANKNQIALQPFYCNNTYDESFFSHMRKAENCCNGFIATHAALSAMFAFISIYNPSFVGASAMSAYATSQWNSLKRYIDYDMHNDYSDLIGAYHYVLKRETTGWWFWRRVTYTTVKVYEKHDGLVANKHSIMDTSSGNVINIALPGVNHMEMNGHPQARTAIIRSLTGLVDSRISVN